MAIFFAWPGAATPAGPPPPWPMPARDRGALVPRSHRRRAKRCRRPRPVACAIAGGADRPVRPRWRSWRPFSVWRGRRQRNFFVQRLGRSCERLIWTPSRSAISAARSRAIVQLRRSATGASSNGVATRNAASLFTGAGPAATLARSALAPSRMKSLRHRRTVSSRTPNASAMRGLVQPASVSNHGTRRSASPRSREPASAVSAARWSSVAEIGDRPVIVGTCESVPPGNQSVNRGSSCQILLRCEVHVPPVF